VCLVLLRTTYYQTICSRLRVREAMMVIVQTEKLGYRNLMELADSWAKATTSEARLRVGKDLDTVSTRGVFAEGKWQANIEKEFLNKYNLIYKDDLENAHHSCIYNQCARSKSDLMKVLLMGGKRKHGYIYSRSGTHISIKTRRQVEFDPSFVYRSESLKKVPTKKGETGGKRGRPRKKPAKMDESIDEEKEEDTSCDIG
jgi:hypothetical protein